LRGSAEEPAELMAEMRLVAEAQLIDHGLVRRAAGDKFAGQAALEFAHPNPGRLAEAQEKGAFELTKRNTAAAGQERRLKLDLSSQAFPVLHEQEVFRLNGTCE
jgi:hypothetical protein